MTSWTSLDWLNEPNHHLENSSLVVTTTPDTDFWRETHYGFVRDSGHFLGMPVSQEFTAQVRIEGQYKTLYDQAGLMLRASETEWVKTGVEYVGHQQFSAVVTHGFSDWSIRPAHTSSAIELKMTRRGNALSVQTRVVDGDWQLLRLAHWPEHVNASIGIFACSPGAQGFKVRFREFEIGPPDDRPLY
ncbi:DUF1349 domain-containing protein [Deinococcus altitudinis]|uniref:DUF1349 domain-containing protein n=1 Tax=Deinococcus altitudinis TaxID=468914 RepID=UPI0038925D2F